MATWTHATASGTGSTGGTVSMTWTTTSDTSSGWYLHEPIAPPPAPRVVPVVRDPFIKKGYWDGVEWEEFTSYIPRKSITGKWIIGPMYRRWRTPSIEFRGPNGIGNHKQYAGRKELFEEKLRGNA